MSGQKQTTIRQAKAKLAGLSIDASALFNRLITAYPELTQSEIADILGVQQLTDYIGKRKALPSLKVAVKAAFLIEQSIKLEDLAHDKKK